MTQQDGEVALRPVTPGVRQLGPTHGLFVKINAAKDADWDTARAFAPARGVQCAITWAQLEPADGVYDFSLIDAWVARAAPKTVLLRYGSSGPTGATPPWFFELPGVPRIEVAGEDSRPIFWDETYLLRQERLFAAIGERYKGHRSLMWRICGWSDASNEPGAYNQLNQQQAVIDAYAGGAILMTVGGKPLFDGGDSYSVAVLRMMRAWRAALPSSRLWLTTHFSGVDPTTEGLDIAMACGGRELRMVLGNTGLNCADKSGARTTFTAWRTPGSLPGVQVGWFDIAPEHVTKACPDLPIRDAWARMLDEAVGSDTLPPPAAVSYVVTGLDSIRVYPDLFTAFAQKLVP